MVDLSSATDAELVVWARMAHEARFCPEADDPVVWQSPMVIDFHCAVLAERARRRGWAAGADDGYDAWLRWSGRAEAAAVRAKLQQDQGLLAYLREQPGERVRALLRPFRLEDRDVAELLETA